MFADPEVAVELRAAAAAQDDLADLRSAGTCATASGGHPTETGCPRLLPAVPHDRRPGPGRSIRDGTRRARLDYLKIIIDDGCCLGYARPTLHTDTVKALIRAAHEHGLMAIVHVLDRTAGRLALDPGADGLAHLIVDATPEPESLPRQLNRERSWFLLWWCLKRSAVTATALNRSGILDSRPA